MPLLTDPRAKARIVELRGEAVTGTPAEFARLIAADAEKWRMVIRVANIKMG
jgi:hypothetical protein